MFSKIISETRAAGFIMTLENTYNSSINLKNISLNEIYSENDVGFFEVRNTNFAKINIDTFSTFDLYTKSGAAFFKIVSENLEMTILNG